MCGLPPACVDVVLDAEFALPPHAVAALQYLKWLAEGHWEHPLFQDFNTVLREALCGITAEAVRLYFQILDDHRYDGAHHWWTRHQKGNWWRYASYLHWVGRTGCALYAPFAKLDPQSFPDIEYAAGIADCRTRWKAANYGRDYSRVRSPKDPVGQIAEPSSQTIPKPLAPDISPRTVIGECAPVEEPDNE